MRLYLVQIGIPGPERTGRRRFWLSDVCLQIDAHCPEVWIAAEYRLANGITQGLGWLTALKSRGALIGS